MPHFRDALVLAELHGELELPSQAHQENWHKGCSHSSAPGLQDLLSTSFRQQMLMDGQYGSITFVATKTDDVSPSEIIDSLATVSPSPTMLPPEQLLCHAAHCAGIRVQAGKCTLSAGVSILACCLAWKC